MNVQDEAPQRREVAEGPREARQPRFIVFGSQLEHLQAPREPPPEGLEAFDSVGEDALDPERTQLTRGDDMGLQLVPERPPEQLVLIESNVDFGQRRGNGGGELAQLPRGEHLEIFVVRLEDVQLAHRAGAPLGPRDDPRGVDTRAVLRLLVRVRQRSRHLFVKVDLERLVQGARVLRAVELSPGLADEGDGVPHHDLVADRHKDGHELVVREVVDGERLGGGADAARIVELASVESFFFGHRFCFFSMLLVGERRLSHFSFPASRTARKHT